MTVLLLSLLIFKHEGTMAENTLIEFKPGGILSNVSEGIAPPDKFKMVTNFGFEKKGEWGLLGTFKQWTAPSTFTDIKNVFNAKDIGERLGIELLLDGDFPDSSLQPPWTDQSTGTGNASAVNNHLFLETDDSSNRGIARHSNVLAGDTKFLVTFDYLASIGTDGEVEVRLGNDVVVTGTKEVGAHSYIITTDAGGALEIECLDDSSEASIDNVSVKKIYQGQNFLLMHEGHTLYRCDYENLAEIALISNWDELVTDTTLLDDKLEIVSVYNKIYIFNKTVKYVYQVLERELFSKTTSPLSYDGFSTGTGGFSGWWLEESTFPPPDKAIAIVETSETGTPEEISHSFRFTFVYDYIYESLMSESIPQQQTLSEFKIKPIININASFFGAGTPSGYTSPATVNVKRRITSIRMYRSTGNTADNAAKSDHSLVKEWFIDNKYPIPFHEDSLSKIWSCYGADEVVCNHEIVGALDLTLANNPELVGTNPGSPFYYYRISYNDGSPRVATIGDPDGSISAGNLEYGTYVQASDDDKVKYIKLYENSPSTGVYSVTIQYILDNGVGGLTTLASEVMGESAIGTKKHVTTYSAYLVSYDATGALVELLKFQGGHYSVYLSTSILEHEKANEQFYELVDEYTEGGHANVISFKGIPEWVYDATTTPSAPRYKTDETLTSIAEYPLGQEYYRSNGLPGGEKFIDPTFGNAVVHNEKLYAWDIVTQADEPADPLNKMVIRHSPNGRYEILPSQNAVNFDLGKEETI